MSSQYNKLICRTRLLLDEAVHTVRTGFRNDVDELLRPAELTQLEQRILMSASPMAASVVDAPEAAAVDSAGDTVASEAGGVPQGEVANSSQSPSADDASSDNASVQSTVELVVIDPSAENYQQLVQDLESQTERIFEILILTPREDGVAQITDALAGIPRVAAIHLVSHGDDGEILLGTSVLSQKNIGRYAAELVTWQNHLTADADLLIYGCDLAASSDGVALTESLNILLSADVAASDDATGQATRGGDWDLEQQVGHIETAVAFTSEAQRNWQGILSLTATGELPVSTTVTDVQETSGENRGSQQAVSMAADGSYVVAWTSTGQDGSSTGIYARRFDSAGVALTGEIQVAQTTADNQQWGKVASDAAGNFVVTWTSSNQDGTLQSVYARLFDASGNALADEFRVNTTATGTQKDSSIARNASGNFIITWEGAGPGDTAGIFYRRFNADGTAIDATDVMANATDRGAEADPDVAINDSGQFAIAWYQGNDLYLRHFAANGAAVSGDVTVDNGLANALSPSVGIDATGRTAVVYRTDGLIGIGRGVWGRTFEADGSQRHTWFQIADSSATSATLDMDAAGNFVVVWENTGDADGKGVYGRHYDADSVAQSDAFLVNTSSQTGDQHLASVALLDKNNYVVVWSGQGAGDADGVFARQFHVAPPVLDLDADNSSGATGLDFNATFTSGGGAVAVVDTDATLTDANDTNLQSLKVNITNRQDGSSEVLAANTSGTSISASFSGSTLTLSGADTVGNYQKVLRTVTYNNGQDPATGTSRTITFIASDGLASNVVATTFLSINQVPTANAGGPYTITEGSNLTLNASASTDPNGDTLTYSWDLDGDAQYDDATGVAPTVLWGSLPTSIRDNGTYTIGVQVDDGRGGVHTDTATLTVTNTVPALAITGTGSVAAGSAYTLNLSATDPGNDTITSWTINWGDGTIDTIAGNPSTATHTYTASQAGFTYNILASATDEDGTYLQNQLIVASSQRDSLFRYGANGAFIEEFAVGDGTDYPVDAVIGPDGNLYVSGWNSDNVLRYNVTTGAFIDTFVAANSGGLNSAAGIAFGPDGNLYVASRLTRQVLRFDASTGAFIDAFVTASSGGLNQAEGLVFGPDGNLYVSDYSSGAIYKYNGTTGAFISQFVTAASGKLSAPEDMAFGPDGNLYVADNTRDSVVRFNGTTGAYIDDFVASGSGGLSSAVGLAFGPDGNLYVSSWQTNRILRYAGSTGAFIDVYTTGGSLSQPDYFNFVPGHQVTVGSAANLAPVNSVPGAQTTPQDSSVVFNSGNGNLISISDADAGSSSLEVTLTANNGTVSVGWPSSTATAVGGEILVNTTTASKQATLEVSFFGATAGDFGSPRSVASDPAGNFVVTWSSKDQDGNNWGIYAQRYNAAGVAQGSEFLVNTTTAKEQVQSSIAMDDDGNFVIAWSSKDQDGDGWDVYAQRFNASGARQGSEFRISTETSKDQLGPSVSMDASGNFVVTWSSNEQDGNKWGVYGQRFDSTGIALDGEFSVNNTTNHEQTASSVAMSADGSFVVTWSSKDQDGDNWGVYGKRYDSSGVAQGREFQINTTTSDEQAFSSVAVDADGNFVVTWSSKDQDGNNWGVYGKRYNAAGNAQGGEFLVNVVTTDVQQYSSVSMDSDGDFVITWTSKNQDGDKLGIYARQYTAAGAAKGGEVLVNSTTTGDQSYSSVAMDAKGSFVVVWSGAGTGDTDGVFAQRVVVPTDITFTTGDGTRDATMTFTGTIANINAVLDGTKFEPAAGYNGLATITLNTNDLGNTGFGGAKMDSDVININVGSGNIAPTLSLPSSAVSYTENGTAVLVDPAATVSDADSTDLNCGQFTVYVHANARVTDRLAIRDQGTSSGQIGLSGSNVTYNFGSGAVVIGTISGGTDGLTSIVVDLNANATVAAVQKLMRNITYENVSDDPRSLSRTVAFRLSDGDGGISAIVRQTVNVTAVNDAPVVDAAQTFSVSEAATNGTSLGIATATDAEAGTTFSNWQITGGNTGSVFAINSTTGELTVNDASKLNYAVTSSYALTVTVSDGSLTSAIQSIAVNVTEAVDISSNLLLHLAFDETSGTVAADSSGNGNNANLNASAENGWTGGVVGSGAFYLNSTSGDEDFFTVPDSPTLQNVQEGSQYTLSAWFNPADVPGGASAADNNYAYGILVKEGTHTGLWYESDQRINFEIWTGGTNYVTVESLNTYAPDQFYHVVATYDNASGIARLFVNGALENSATFTPGITTPDYGTETWKVGTARDVFATNDSAYPASGVIDDVRIYGRALGTTDVAALYTLGTTGNRNPIASAGGTYTTTPGNPVTLNASGSTDLDGDTLTYRWDLDNDGDFLEAGEPTGASPTVAWSTLQSNGVNTLGNHTIGVRVEDGKGGVDIATTTLTIVAGTPTANAGTVYSIAEGGSLTLDASGSSDPDSDPLTYEWDLNYNGTFGSDITGVNPTVNWAALQAAGVNDNGTYQVALRVHDGSSYSTVVQQTLTVTNVAPTLNITGAATANSGTAYTLNLSVTDPGNDTISNWVINWGDGSIQTVTGNPGSVTHVYTNDGFTNGIIVSATDEDGTYTPSDLYVTSFATNQLFRYDGQTGVPLSASAAIANPVDVRIGPDGLLYVTEFGSNDIDRFDPATGLFVDTFVYGQSGGLQQPSRMAFGADGNLYVSSQNSGNILKFSGTDGRSLGVFVPSGAGGLTSPDGLTFGPDGHLYVSSFADGDIRRYEGKTGAFLNTFASFGTATHIDMHFGPNGNLFASATNLNVVREFDAGTGAVIGDVVSAGSGGMTAAGGFTWAPDGSLLVADFGGDRILHFTSSGAFIGEFAGTSAGMDQPIDLTYTPSLQVNVNSTPIAVGDAYTLDEGGTLNVSASTDWFNLNWNSRTQITFNNAAQAENLTNVPVLVKLHATASDAVNVDYTRTQNFGEDLRFVDSSGNVLAHEIETWNEAGYSYVWVNVPMIAAGSATDSIWLYYENPDAADGGALHTVWDSSDTVVLHMNGTTVDSTSYGNDGGLTAVTVAPGVVGDAGSFNGTNSSVSLGSDATVDDIFAGGGTISTWINPTGWGGGGYGRILDKASTTFSGSAGNGWTLQVQNDGSLRFEHGFSIGKGSWVTSPGTISLNTWQNVVVTYNNSSSSNTPQVYINGVLQTLTTANGPLGTATSDAALNLVVGSYGGGTTRTFQGQIDEVQISNAVTSASEIAARFASVNGTFLTAGAAVSGPGGVLDNDSDADGDNVTLTLVSGPARAVAGSFVLNSDGSFTYTHDDSETTTDSFTYTINDGLTTSTPVTVSLSITAINDNVPEITAGQSFDISEIATVGTVVGTVAATDADAGTTLSNWTIGSGNDDGIFGINSSTGQITVVDNTKLNFSATSSYSLGLTVSDGTNTSAIRAITIAIADANNNAPVITPGQVFTVSEASANAYSMGTVLATDTDSGTTLSGWTITAGNVDGVFALNSTTGELTVVDASKLNYESITNYTLTLTVSDGTHTSLSQGVAVNVTDFDEFDVGAITDTNAAIDAVNENSVNGTLVGITASASDADGSNNTIVYTLDNSAGGRFAIDGSTGVVSVANGSLLDRETAASHTIVVKATSADGSSQTQTFDISIADVNEFGITAIADTNTGTNVVDENSAIGATVGITAFASDADGADEISYSLSLNPGSQFAIDSATGVVTTNASLDSEAARSIVISVLATSTDGSTSSQDFNVIVQDLNDNAPRITVGQSFIVSEFANVGDTVGVVTATDADATASTISWSIVSGNGDGVFAINGATGQITIADSTNLDFELMPNYSLGISVTDGVNAATTASVAVAIGNENDAPSIGAIADIVTNEDTTVGPIAFTVSDVDTSVNALTVTATSSDQNLIRDADILLGGSGANRTISLSPVANANGGPVTITVSVSDGASVTTETFDVTITAVNDVPTISTIANVNLEEDTPSAPIQFLINDLELDSGSLVVTATSSDQSLVVDSDIVVYGDGQNRRLVITPRPNQFGGPVTFTVTVSDGELSSSTTFTGTIAAVNDSPEMSSITDVTIQEDSAGGSVTFQVSDVDNSTTSLTVSATSSNQSLIADGAIVVSGTGVSRTVSFTSASNVSGTATISIVLSDGLNSVTQEFDVNVTPVNDAPTIGAISNVTINEDSVAGPIVFAIADVDNTFSQLTVTATSSNSDLIKSSNIRLGGSGGNRVIRLNPVGNAFGTSTITVTVSDGQATTSTTFQLVVLPVNDAPVLRRSVSHTYNVADGENLTVVSPGLLNGFSDVEGDAMSVVVVVAPKHGTVVVNADGSFTYAPTVGYSGDDSFQFEVTDGRASSSDSTVRIFVPTSVAGFNTALNSNSTDSTSDSTSDRTTTISTDESMSSQTSEGDMNGGADVLADASAGLPSGVARGSTNDDDRSVFVMPESGDNSDDDAAIAFFAPKVATNDDSEGARTQLQISQAESERGLSSGLKSDGQTTIDIGAVLNAVPVGSGVNMNVGMQFRYGDYAELKGTVEQLGSFEENIPTSYGITNMTATTVAAAGASVVFGSVVTAHRTGMLALIFLGQLPVWTIFDPLMVMDGVSGPDDGDSLQDIVDGQTQDNVPDTQDAGHKPK